jgi:hypothetical protein
MNERIKRLYNGAVVYTMDNAGRKGQASSNKMCAEKFAELIVKECLSFCEYQGDRFDEYDSGMTERARIIRESIQEHFGVKV